MGHQLKLEAKPQLLLIGLPLPAAHGLPHTLPPPHPATAQRSEPPGDPTNHPTCAGEQPRLRLGMVTLVAAPGPEPSACRRRCPGWLAAGI